MAGETRQITLETSETTKHYVQIFMQDKTARIPRNAQENLKGLISGKRMSRMKREWIYCPVLHKERSFIECFACESFIRRFKGEVHCAGGKATVFS